MSLAFIDGVAVLLFAAPGALAKAFGAIEVVAPRQFLTWREDDTPSHGLRRRALQDADVLWAWNAA